MDYLKEVPSYFDIQIFQNLPLYIRVRILKEGKILLCKDENKLYELALLTVKDFEQFKPLYKSYIEHVLK